MVVGPIADQLASDIRSALKAPSAEAGPPISALTLLEALGGRANVREVKLAASRLCVAVKNADAVVDSRIAALTVRGVATAGAQQPALRARSVRRCSVRGIERDSVTDL